MEKQEEKKSYEKPELVEYEDLKSITAGVGNELTGTPV